MILRTNKQGTGKSQSVVSQDQGSFATALSLVSGMAATPLALPLPLLASWQQNPCGRVFGQHVPGSYNPKTERSNSSDNADNLRPIAPGEVYGSP